MLLGLTAALSGCVSDSDVRVRLAASEGFVAVSDPTADGASVGLSADALVLLWDVPGGPETRGTRMGVDRWAAWFDRRTGVSSSDSYPLGPYAAHSSRLAMAADGTFWAQHIGAPDGVVDVADEEVLHVLELAESGAPVPHRISIELAQRAESTWSVGLAGVGEGFGPLSAVATSEGVSFAVTAFPRDCPSDVGAARVHVFSSRDLVARVLSEGPVSCPSIDDSGLGRAWTHPLIIDTHAAQSLLLSRGDYRDGRLAQAAQIGGLALGEQRRVGGIDWSGPPVPQGAGFELSAARAVSSVLLAERDGLRQGNSCSRLRVLELDGRDARDAPFQLECQRQSPGRVITAFVDMVSTPLGAFFVWGERTGPLVADTSAPGYRERIRAVLLDSSGRRTSDIVDVTPDGAVAPGEFVPIASASGNDVAVAWRDARMDAPGIWVRILHAEALAP